MSFIDDLYRYEGERAKLKSVQLRNSIVIGNPGKIIQKDSSPTEKYEIYRVQ